MKLSRFAMFAWSVLAYNVAVVLWGAYVRATKSGAGCGSHWPLCNGIVIPRAPAIETIVEFTHRATSGIALLLVVGLVIWALRAFPRGHIVRLGVKFSLFFMITEALVGAGLVLFELVADNESIARAFSMAVHLFNTFLLLAALTLTAWWASGGKPFGLKEQGVVAWLLGFGLLGVLVTAVTGSLIALGDTLFPHPLTEGARQQLSSTVHWLVQLRPFHPLIAVGIGIYLIAASGVIHSLRPSYATKRFGQALAALFVVQLFVGMLTVLLRAPVLMQIVHLLLADLLWIALVLLAASALAQKALRTEPVEQLQPAPQLRSNS